MKNDKQLLTMSLHEFVKSHLWLKDLVSREKLDPFKTEITFIRQGEALAIDVESHDLQS